MENEEIMHPRFEPAGDIPQELPQEDSVADALDLDVADAIAAVVAEVTADPNGAVAAETAVAETDPDVTAAVAGVVAAVAAQEIGTAEAPAQVVPVAAEEPAQAAPMAVEEPTQVVSVPAGQEAAWFDGIMGGGQTHEQVGANEMASQSTGMFDPRDFEVEQIIRETKAQEAQEVIAQQPAAEPVGESYFAPAADLPVAEQQPQPVVEEPAEELPQEREPVVKKRRPRMKKGAGLFGIPHLLSTAVWAFIVLAVGVSLGRLLWVCCTDVLAFGKNPKETVITIQKGDDMEDVARKLYRAGMIEYPELFLMYMSFSDSEMPEEGVHQLKPMIYDYHAIKTALEPKTAARGIVEVVIPEGYTCAQIFALLEEKGVCTVTELELYAENGDLNDYWFLEGVERGHKYCLEGYLFPDTYQFYKGHDPELVLEKMLDNFEYRFTDIMKDKIDTLNEYLAKAWRNRGYDEAYIKEHAFTIREVVTVASMIERETASGSESYEIASVIYNRLTNPGSFPYLQIDATVIYGMGGPKVDPATGESLPLTKADLERDTPYNSYTRKGLIPGPISNPGRNSLNAALDPNDTSYYYYVYDPSQGAHLFATTEAGHEQNKDRVKNRD